MASTASSGEISVSPALPDGLSKKELKRLARLLARLPKSTPPDEVADLMADLSERFADWKGDLKEDEEMVDVAYDSEPTYHGSLGMGASLPPSPTGAFSFSSLPRVMEVHTSRCYLGIYSKGRKAPSPRSRKADAVDLKVASMVADQAQIEQ